MHRHELRHSPVPARRGPVAAGPRFGLPSGLADGRLIVPVPGADYGEGEIVPLVRGRFGVRETGLIVPIAHARPPVPLDTIATYLTGPDVVGFPIPAELVIDTLEHLPVTGTLEMCAGVLRAVDDRRCGQAETDAVLRPWFTEHGWRRVRALTASGERLLVGPHVLMVAMTLAARFSPDREPEGDVEVSPIVALLGAADHLERLGNPQLDDARDGDGDFVVGAGLPGRIEREMVAIGDFHGRLEPEHLIARMVRRWIELPTEHADHADVIDVSGEFAKATGVSVEEFITAGLVLFNGCLELGPRLPRDILRRAGLGPQTDRIIRGLVTTTVPELRKWARGATEASVWDFSHLGQFPLVDDGETLLGVRPRMILDRFFGWLPYLDVEQTMSGSGRERLRVCFGRLAEFYALETLRAQAAQRGYRLVEERELRSRLRGRKAAGRICDAALFDGRRWALFEITSSRLTRPSVLATSGDKLDGDMAKLLGKIEQLHDTICVLREREPALSGQPAQRRRRFHPVLVLTETFPTNPVTVTMLRARAQEAGFLLGDDVAELEVVEVVELEIVEGAHLGEPGLIDVLDAKQRSTLHRSSLRDFLILAQKTTAVSPPRVTAYADRARTIARTVLDPSGHT